MRKLLFLFLLLPLLSLTANASDVNFVHVRVVDVGAASCNLVELPGGEYMVFDAGYNKYDPKANKNAAMAAISTQIQELIPNGEPIDLLVISHQHYDHLSALSTVLHEYMGHTVSNLLVTGNDYYVDDLQECLVTTPDFPDLDDVLNDDHNGVYLVKPAEPGNPDNTGIREIQHGEELGIFTDAEAYLLAGWGYDHFNDGEPNSTSIVLKLVYDNKSVLFTGDTNFEHHTAMGNPEGYMIHNNDVLGGNFLLKSDVVIVPHHGSRTSSSWEFIKRIQPEFVVIPSGHMYGHPSRYTAWRYEHLLAQYGLDRRNIFRTDWGDDEGFSEWDYGSVDDTDDTPGDDNVDIWLFEDGYVSVNWYCPRN